MWEAITGVLGLLRELLGFRSTINEHDVELYEAYKALFVNNSAAEFYRQHDFLGSFEEKYWAPLSRYVDNWHTVEHEFVNSKLRRKHAAVYKAAEKLGGAISMYTVPIGDGSRRSVKPDHIHGPTPNIIKDEARQINALKPAFVKAHQKFIRVANKKLRKRVG